jgi:hypothetical protein
LTRCRWLAHQTASEWDQAASDRNFVVVCASLRPWPSAGEPLVCARTLIIALLDPQLSNNEGSVRDLCMNLGETLGASLFPVAL